MSLAALLSLLLYWGAATLTAVLFLRRDAETSPEGILRSSALQLIVPAVLFASLTTALLLPSLTEALLGIDPHHPAGAGLSLHGLVGDAVQGVALALLTGLMVWAWLPPLFSWARLSVLARRLLCEGSRRRVHDLVTPRRHGRLHDRDVVVVPGAWIGLVGVLRPKLVVGEELLSGLREPELAAALAHEDAHERARHPRRRLLLLILSRMLPVWGRRLVGRWTAAAEILCDQAAARVVEDPAWVASALLSTHRLQRAWASSVPRLQESPVALGFASPDSLAQRVESLLEVPKTDPNKASAPPLRAWLLLGAVSLAVIVMHVPLHHAVERLLDIIH